MYLHICRAKDIANAEGARTFNYIVEKSRKSLHAKRNVQSHEQRAERLSNGKFVTQQTFTAGII